MSQTDVTLVDYGIGNLRSMEKALEAAGAVVNRTDDPIQLLRAERLVLPGVGAFGACRAELVARDLLEVLTRYAQTGRPLLGVCVGMQLLLNQSEEFGLHAGLGLIPGRIARFSREAGAASATQASSEHDELPTSGDTAAPLKIPHMGWNTVEPAAGIPWLGSPATYYYFVHSFRAVDVPQKFVAGQTRYGSVFPAAVAKDHIWGVQFHPEKSADAGIALLRAFLNQ